MTKTIKNYEEELVKSIFISNYGVDKNEKLVRCSELECKNCVFAFGKCDETKGQWLEDEIDTSDKVAIDMICESCGGLMQLQNEIGHHVLYCPYCRTKRVLV